MKRNLKRLADETFDLLIVGGGITGACVARDASLRGLKVALIERNDFANATSAHNSKLVHGGLRYLRNLELRLVRESLKERRIWQRIAPHLVHPLPFLVPLYNAGFKGRATLSAGLTLYDLLSYDRAWLEDPDQQLPGHHWLGAREALAQEPVLECRGLDGAFAYYDAQMYSPERLALECLIDADAHGAAIANYVEAKSFIARGGRAGGVSAVDKLKDSRFDIRALTTLVATGPWSDIFLASALGRPASHRILRSKGIHLLVPSLTRGHAITMATEAGHFFVLPWREHTLVGTTDTEFTGDPDSLSVSERDIGDFLALINKHLPNANLTRDDVSYFYAGLRPLVDDGSGDTYGASRRSELVDHGRDDGMDALFSAIGGKWTTSRDLAQKIVDAIGAKLGRSLAPCTTATLRLPGARFERLREFIAQQKALHRSAASMHLIHSYGARLTRLFAETQNRPDLFEPLGGHGDIAAQIVFAAREEMALTLSDAILRRTAIGQFGPPPKPVLETASRLMGAELGWSEERRQQEVESLAPWFETREAA
jgi:glycerol-3-phosphate dehydrogenase